MKFWAVLVNQIVKEKRYHHVPYQEQELEFPDYDLTEVSKRSIGRNALMEDAYAGK